MRKPLFLWQAAGFAFATLAGTILHFLYDWSGKFFMVAPFSGVNESTCFAIRSPVAMGSTIRRLHLCPVHGMIIPEKGGMHHEHLCYRNHH